MYAEYLAEDLLLDLPHRQFVFTIPKMLRPLFKAGKRLFGGVSRLLFTLLSGFFSLAAGFTRSDRFVYLRIGADEGMLKVWQAAILPLFLRRKLIDQARVNMLKAWKHSGFSMESEIRLFDKADREALWPAIQSQTIQETPLVDVKSSETNDAWAKQQEKEPQLTACARSPQNLALVSV